MKQKQLDGLLIICVMKENMEMAKFLISQGADVNYALPSGVTALLSAVQVNNREIIELLMKNDADALKEVTLPDGLKTNAINYARGLRNENLAKFLELLFVMQNTDK